MTPNHIPSDNMSELHITSGLALGCLRTTSTHIERKESTMKASTWMGIIPTIAACICSSASASDATGDRLNIGVSHTLTGGSASIAGGIVNTNSGDLAFIGAGIGNSITAEGSTIMGG